MFVFLVLFLVTLSNVFTTAESENTALTWKSLRTTWSMDDPNVNPYAFAKMPIKLDEALKKGFRPMKKNQHFKGNRYINGSDTSIILIFDTIGEKRLVGFQLQWPKSEIAEQFLPWFERPFFVKEERDGKNYFAITTYTVNPATIGKKNSKNRCSKPAGCGFWQQIGPNTEPKNILKIPDTIDVIPEMWVKAKCVFRMGRHYILNVTKEMDCNNFPPFNLVFVEGKLSAMTYLSIVPFKFTPRLEPFPKNALSLFFYEYPDCLNEAYDASGGFVSFHHFFNEDPDKYQCPPDED